MQKELRSYLSEGLLDTAASYIQSLDALSISEFQALLEEGYWSTAL
jgi:hypothetical protein